MIGRRAEPERRSLTGIQLEISATNFESLGGPTELGQFDQFEERSGDLLERIVSKNCFKELFHLKN